MHLKDTVITFSYKGILSSYGMITLLYFNVGWL